MNKALTKLRSALAEISDIRAAISLLGWDQQTYLPTKGGEGRGHQISTLESIAHSQFVSAEIGRHPGERPKWRIAGHPMEQIHMGIFMEYEQLCRHP